MTLLPFYSCTLCNSERRDFFYLPLTYYWLVHYTFVFYIVMKNLKCKDNLIKEKMTNLLAV